MGAAVSSLLVLTAALVGAAMPLGVAAPAGAAVPAGAAGSARPAGESLAAAVVRRGPPGTAVVTDGPLTAAQFASYSPDPAATTDLLGNLTAAGTVRTYQRVWADRQFDVAVTDLVAAFSTPAEAAAYRTGQADALATANAVTTAPVPGVPGARRDAYPITSPVAGTEQVVVLAAHNAVATLSFTLAAPTATDPEPATVTAAGVDAFAVRQHRRLVTALATPPAADPASGPSAAVDAGWVLLAVAAGLVVVLGAVLVRRRRVRP
ncbi:MAG TPA: hypothetical protein VHX40_08270 [Acidimicrobiales bacterium]|nr:hypothetical protein [Acidimicrobiales bacterium]